MERLESKSISLTLINLEINIKVLFCKACVRGADIICNWRELKGVGAAFIIASFLLHDGWYVMVIYS